MTDDQLHIDFAGVERTLSVGEQLTFGRDADLEIDENLQLHRLLGRFYNEAGVWWVRNEGRSLEIQLIDRDSRTSSTIASGRAAAISFPRAALRFRAGPTEYELLLTTAVAAVATPAPPQRGDTTFVAGRSVPLTVDQKRALVVLAEAALRNPHLPPVIASNAEMAHRLGWTPKRLDRKIDNLCEKFDKAGVRGLRGSLADSASDRRRLLVEHVVANGLVAVEDLALLDPSSTAQDS